MVVKYRCGSGGGGGWIGWLSTTIFGSFKLEIKKMNKTISEATLPPIVPILFCQVSHPPFKNPGSATEIFCISIKSRLKDVKNFYFFLEM